MTEKEVFNRLRTNQNWYGKSYSGHFIGIYEQGLAIAREAANNSYTLDYGLVFLNYKEKEQLEWFWDKDNMRKKREMILEKVKTDKDFPVEVLRTAEENHQKFKKYSNKISSFDLALLDNQKLRTTFKKLHKLLLEVSLWSYAVDAFLSDGEEDWLEIILKENLGKRTTPEIIEILTLPTFNSFVNDAELLFLKIVKQVKKNDIDRAQKLVVEYEDKYFWIRSNYHEYKRLKAETVINEANTWIEENLDKNLSYLIEEQNARIEGNKIKKSKIYKDLNIPNWLQSILFFSEIFTHLQDNRKERVLRMNTLFYEFIDETAHRFNLKQPLGFYMTSEELFSLYDGKKIDQAKIQDRYDNGFLALFVNDKAKLISAEEYKKEGIDKNFFHTFKDITEIKATTAFRGKVRGTVRILRNIKEIGQFKKGEILVANQTTPEYVPAMKKAAALITDQGGITSHAAIIARELKLPAIIGTKIGTQVLKDGDLVEVDADNGIVRILGK